MLKFEFICWGCEIIYIRLWRCLYDMLYFQVPYLSKLICVLRVFSSVFSRLSADDSFRDPLWCKENQYFSLRELILHIKSAFTDTSNENVKGFCIGLIIPISRNVWSMSILVLFHFDWPVSHGIGGVTILTGSAFDIWITLNRYSFGPPESDSLQTIPSFRSFGFT